jgi:hypothetical protein
MARQEVRNVLQLEYPNSGTEVTKPVACTNKTGTVATEDGND